MNAGLRQCDPGRITHRGPRVSKSRLQPVLDRVNQTTSMLRDRIRMIRISEEYFPKIFEIIRFGQIGGQLANVIVVSLPATEYRQHFRISAEDAEVRWRKSA